MVHSVLHIKASQKQLAKLRKGHPVRVKPEMEGEGFNLIVYPERYSIVSKTFNKGKGAEIQLTPEEIVMNKGVSPEEHLAMKEKYGVAGRGIFGHSFDKAMKNILGKQGKKALYQGAKAFVEPVKAGIDQLAGYAPEIATGALSGLALATGQPELLPLAGIAGHQLGTYLGRKGADVAKDYLEHPSSYHKRITSNIGGPRNAIAPSTLAGQVQQNELFANLNQELGTQYGLLSQATLANALAQMERSRVANERLMKRREEIPSVPLPLPSATIPERYLKSGLSGQGLYAGKGLRGERGSVGKGGSLISHTKSLPPALVSQPFSANFQFQHTLPPSVQKFSSGGGLYV